METHPESYFPRVFVCVREEGAYYELLKNSTVTQASSPEGAGFTFWIIDVDRTADMGISRANAS